VILDFKRVIFQRPPNVFCFLLEGNLVEDHLIKCPRDSGRLIETTSARGFTLSGPGHELNACSLANANAGDG